MTDTTIKNPITYMVVAGIGHGIVGVGRALDRLFQPQFMLAIGSGVFLYWLTSRLLSGNIPENARELVAALVGFISGQMVGPAWQFYLGTTQGSEKKTVALADNAAFQRQTGELSPPREPMPVVVKQPDANPVPVTVPDAPAAPDPAFAIPDRDPAQQGS